MDERGQSLLEISITIGVIVVIIAGLAVITINGLRNSQLSKNQTQATKLAQEGLEKVKVIKARNLAVCGPTSQAIVQWNDLWAKTLNSVVDATCNASETGCKYTLKDTGSMSCVGLSSVFWLESSSTPEKLTGDFKRQIVISDYDVTHVSTQKRVTVYVTWTDTAGSHESRLATVLGKY